jgi:hypothetical protein
MSGIIDDYDKSQKTAISFIIPLCGATNSNRQTQGSLRNFFKSLNTWLLARDSLHFLNTAPEY